MSSSSVLPATFNKIYQQLCNSSKAQKDKLAVTIFSSFGVELSPIHYTQITGAEKVCPESVLQAKLKSLITNDLCHFLPKR